MIPDWIQAVASLASIVVAIWAIIDARAARRDVADLKVEVATINSTMTVVQNSPLAMLGAVGSIHGGAGGSGGSGSGGGGGGGSVFGAGGPGGAGSRSDGV